MTKRCNTRFAIAGGCVTTIIQIVKGNSMCCTFQTTSRRMYESDCGLISRYALRGPVSQPLR